MDILYVESNLNVKVHVGELPLFVIQRLGKMDDYQQETFLDEFKRRKKSVGAGVGLAFLNSEYFYLGDIGMGLVKWTTLGGFWVWWVVNLFRVAGMVRKYNANLAVDILRMQTLVDGVRS